MEKFRGFNEKGIMHLVIPVASRPPPFAGTRGMPAPSPCHPLHCRYLNDPEACAAFLARSVITHPRLPLALPYPPCRYLNDPEACAAFLARSVDSLPVDHEAGGELKVWMWDMKCGSGMAVQN